MTVRWLLTGSIGHVTQWPLSHMPCLARACQVGLPRWHRGGPLDGVQQLSLKALCKEGWRELPRECDSFLEVHHDLSKWLGLSERTSQAWSKLHNLVSHWSALLVSTPAVKKRLPWDVLA